MRVIASIFWVAGLSWQASPDVVEHRLWFEAWSPVYGLCETDPGEVIPCVEFYEAHDTFSATIQMPETHIDLPPEIGWPGDTRRMAPGDVVFFQLYGVTADGCETDTGWPPVLP